MDAGIKLVSLDELRWFSLQQIDFDMPDYTIWHAVILILYDQGFSQEIAENYFNLLQQVEMDAYDDLEKLYLKGRIKFYQHTGREYSQQGEAVKVFSDEELGGICLDISDAVEALEILNHRRYQLIARYHVPHFIFCMLQTEIIRSKYGDSHVLKHSSFLDSALFDDVVHTAVFSEISLRKWQVLIKQNQMADMELEFEKASVKKKSYDIDFDKGMISVLVKLLCRIMPHQFIKKSQGDINFLALSKFILLNVSDGRDFIKLDRLQKVLAANLRDFDVTLRPKIYLEDRDEKTVVMKGTYDPDKEFSGPINPKYLKAPKSKNK